VLEINLNETVLEFLNSEQYNLTTDELKIIMSKQGMRNQLLFAVMLQYYKIKITFPTTHNSLVSYLSSSMAKEIKTEPCYFHELELNHRTVKRFRQIIRGRFGFRESTDEDSTHFVKWLAGDLLPKMPQDHELKSAIRSYYQSVKIEPFSDKQQERYIDSAKKKLEINLFTVIETQLTQKNRDLIDVLLNSAVNEEINEKQRPREINLNTLKKGIPGAKLKHVQLAIGKYQTIRTLLLPDSSISGFHRKILLKYYDRIMAYSPSHIKALDERAKYSTMGIFCHIRSEILADNLADLFLKLVKKIKNASETHVNKTVVKEIKRVEGKFDILYKLADASLEFPDGIIKDTIYPIVDIETLKRLIEDLNQRGNWYQKQVRIKMRSLYSHGSRAELLDLLTHLKFDAYDDEHKALLEAIHFIIQHRDSLNDTYEQEPPLKHVIPDNWFDFVIEDKTESSVQVNRLNYEIVVCNEIRRRLTYKGLWIEGSYRYRDPKKDLPPDFEENRVEYYKKIGLPLDPREFTRLFKEELRYSLSSLNETIPTNDKVSILNKNNGHIKISPSLPQKSPENITELQNDIIKRWGHINLIDAFKEVHIRIGFIRHLETVGLYSKLDIDQLVTRLLLSLYAIGSNTGLKRISIANAEANEAELHYVKRRHINPTNVRLAIREVVNAVIKVRDPSIWGTATTSVACDSKKLKSWDQNLMTEWHGRYKGHGIMVYWHVDGNSLCIHSQSKTCTSSEVGAMIKGVLEHSTQMDLNAAYVDTHGQSTIGFGISKLLKFELLPRLKNIHKQKLYIVSDSDKQTYKNLTVILKDSIQWKHIETHYDEVVKYLVALKMGLVEADVFVKRFSKDNYKHPVYKALCEIGKAAKTIFLCNYLQQESLRIEINAGLNIVERLNSVMNFFFYGKLGEINSNDPEEQELSILCLHLLQACAVYINTLLIQEILSDPKWRNKLKPEDYRALSPLFHNHFNPYGTFLLDLAKRLMISKEDFAHVREKTHTSQRKSKTVAQTT
jgi:TnpA family transposase